VGDKVKDKVETEATTGNSAVNTLCAEVGDKVEDKVETEAPAEL
jgi:hypothetical protein